MYILVNSDNYEIFILEKIYILLNKLKIIIIIIFCFYSLYLYYIFNGYYHKIISYF
jgi:hypothetical protein